MAICLGTVWYFKGCLGKDNNLQPALLYGPEAVIYNYGEQIKALSTKYNVKPEYFAALCMIECGGRKPAPTRFEKHIYSRLKLLKLGLKKKYEHVKQKDIEDASDEALQNLSSSWGPFQLMGYKCLIFDIEVRDLRGSEDVYWGMTWIMLNYGKYLKKGEYRHAFHFHNTGKPFPKNNVSLTHDPEYVRKGLKWMNYFEGKL